MIPGKLNQKHGYISIGIAGASSNSSCRPYQSNNLPSSCSGGGGGVVVPLLNCIEDPSTVTPTISNTSSRLHTPDGTTTPKRLKTPNVKDRFMLKDVIGSADSCNDSIHSNSSRKPVRSSTHYKEDI